MPSLPRCVQVTISRIPFAEAQASSARLSAVREPAPAPIAADDRQAVLGRPFVVAPAAEPGVPDDLVAGESDERALREGRLVGEPVLERDRHRLGGGHVRPALDAERIRLAQQLRPLGDGDEVDAWRRLDRRLFADRPHLLDLPIDLLEPETAREGERACVVAVDVRAGGLEAEPFEVSGELDRSGGSDAASTGSREDAWGDETAARPRPTGRRTRIPTGRPSCSASR